MPSGSPTTRLALARPLLASGLALAACAGHDAGAPALDERLESARRPAAALVDAAPHTWPEAVDAVLAAGVASPARALLDAVTRHPAGAGAECAVALAARCGAREVESELSALLAAGEPRVPPLLGARVAAALGTLDSPTAVDALTRAMDSRALAPLVRTAAAAALLDRGRRGDVPRFLGAVLLAGTPAGIAESTRLGLPDKARWAHERLLAIEAIVRASGGEDFGLHHDASWPALEIGTARMLAFFTAGPR
ncbi:MAG: hypothetical protein IT457_22285 [Planctomycetes bacterium]|nr:hypothetical protein [Planctomycetota bacterium]